MFFYALVGGLIIGTLIALWQHFPGFRSYIIWLLLTSLGVGGMVVLVPQYGPRAYIYSGAVAFFGLAGLAALLTKVLPNTHWLINGLGRAAKWLGIISIAFFAYSYFF